MEKQYNPAIVEDRIYTMWLENNCFAGCEKSEKESYSIVIPPPNVTGILHMGHALNNTIQDILIRYNRMKGFETVWIPGMDHAGIATQNVVERKLAQDDIDRHRLGRDAFVTKVWEWKEQYHASIVKQLKKLGISCDWDRERFTMDEGLSNAVKKVFVTLYNDGLIYRGKYIINWCPRCKTALSDEEAEHKDLEGNLWYFQYPLISSNESITVATTRPETMLGDTAVAVNPSDERYKHIIGQKILLPIVEREIPIIGDISVDKDFGTGAVKVTPAHDPNDFLIGQRHGLKPIVIMDEDAKMCGSIPQKYTNLERFECRLRVIEEMSNKGLLEKTELHSHAVGHCYRCHTMVEPYYSDQWFVKMKPLAKKALQAAKDETIQFYPKRWTKTYCEWMENIRDWCISRQIWWGHRIPVWYCHSCNETIASESTLTSCPHCSSSNILQDEDVLDTWFSSWLWPFSALGWPENTQSLQKFYPTKVLATGSEILFFWVARMVMAGYYCTGKLPFTSVILHGTVRDKSGTKMSKSLGNTIDPIDIIEQYGSDALRFSMIMITAQGADVFIEKDTFDIGRNFANKLWNASRFLLGNIDNKLYFSELPNTSSLKSEDLWILSRYGRTIEQVHQSLNSFRFNEYCHLVYDFVWHDFCDWFLEAKKTDLYNHDDDQKKKNSLNIGCFLLAGILKLLHPVMPHITEEIWAFLKEKIEYPLVVDPGYLINVAFPKENKNLIDGEMEEKFTLLQDIIVALRTIRSENNIPPDKKGTAIIIPINDNQSQWLCNQILLINTFAKLSQTTIDLKAKKPNFSGQSVVKGAQIFLAFEGLINREVEIERLRKEIVHLEKIAESARKRLGNSHFIEKAPKDIVARENSKYEGICLNLETLKKSLKSIVN